MPTFQAPGTESPPVTSAGNGTNLFSGLTTGPSGSSLTTGNSLFAKVADNDNEAQTTASTSLFNNSVNSTTSLDDLLTWPSSAKKPTAQKTTGPSLFSQPPSQSKPALSVPSVSNIFAAKPANPSPLGTTEPQSASDEKEMDFENELAVPDFARSMFSKTVRSPGQHVKPVPTFQRQNFPSSKTEERTRASQQSADTTAPKRKVVPRKGPSPYPDGVLHTVIDAPVAELGESDLVIAQTEDAISRLYESLAEDGITDDKADDVMSAIASDLIRSWEKTLPPMEEVKLPGAVGPGLRSSDFAKATFLASLALSLRHPPPLKEEDASTTSFRQPFPFRPLGHSASADNKTPIPKVLFNWLEKHHPAHPDLTEALSDVTPNPTASLAFWLVLNYFVLRANFARAISLLEKADFSVARSALEDGYEVEGYRGQHLQNVQKVVNTAVRTLRASPANSGNWDVKGVEWSVYRKQVLGAVGELDALVELRRYSPGTTRHSARLGLPSHHGSGVSFSHAARMADTQLPLTVYQRLKTMYEIILGDVDAILENSQDWVEATVALTCWWDGEETKQSPRKQETSLLTRRADDSPREAYHRRLAAAFATATSRSSGQEASFQVSILEPVEAGLACLFDGQFESLMRLLRYWSLPVAAAVAEFATQGGWYECEQLLLPLPGLSEVDRMIINSGFAEKPLRKDDVMINYAEALFSRKRTIDDGNGARESWEMALEILGRLEDRDLMKQEVSTMIDHIPLDTAEQMDKVVLLCTELGFLEQGRRVSERYGDKVAETSDEYGTVLLCYARGHCKKKIRKVVDLLTSFCLVQSVAYPPADSLDPELRALLHDPQTSFKAIRAVDEQGAEMLDYYFSGYAAVRRFYEIRDEGLSLQKGEIPKHRPLARKKAAASTLVGLIKTASTCISGGLYDHEYESSVQVDGLLVLLGEALVFCNDLNRFFTIDQQYDILAAIEDLQTVTSRVYEQCEECLESTLWHHNQFDGVTSEKRGPSSSRKADFSFSISTGSGLPAKSLLSQSISSEAFVSGFSLIAEELLGESNGDQPQKQHEESIERTREWDWRTGIREGTNGADILRMLRLQLARGLSFAALGN